MGSAHQIITHGVQGWYGAQEFFAPNPDFDASINYYLRGAAAGQATIDIFDVYGSKIRTLSGPAGRGMNHVGWNLRGDAPATAAPPGGGAAGGRAGGQAQGALVAPGKYTVVVKIPGLAKELRGDVVVEADPIKK